MGLLLLYACDVVDVELELMRKLWKSLFYSIIWRIRMSKIVLGTEYKIGLGVGLSNKMHGGSRLKAG